MWCYCEVLRRPAVLDLLVWSCKTFRNAVGSIFWCAVPPVSTIVSLCRPLVLQALIGLFELPEDDSVPDDEHFVDIEDTPGYQTAFSQLAFAGKKEHDPIGDAVRNPKILLAQSLHKLSTAFPGRVSPPYTSRHGPDFSIIIIGNVAVQISQE